MSVFTIHVVRTDRSRETYPATFPAARPAFEVAFKLANELADEQPQPGRARPSFVDVYEGDRLCIGIGVGTSTKR